jgi:thymidylate kinase
MELTGSEFHARVAAAFRLFATEDWQKEHRECGEIVTIDASASEDEVFASVMRELGKRWPERFGSI